MSNTKREYPCKDWWWIDPEIGGVHLSNRTTRAIEKWKESTILSLSLYGSDSEEGRKDQRDLDKYCEELESRKINPREGDVF